MILILLAVDSLSSIAFREEFAVEGSVKHVPVNLCVSESLITDYFQKSGASGAGATQYENHFAGLRDTLEVFQDIEFLAFFAKTEQVHESFVYVEEGDECVWERLESS
jgi:hypothetical protein